jgi:hypothetical protein
MKKTPLVVLSLLTLSLKAQTAVTVTQIQIPADTVHRVMVALPTGEVLPVRLGTGISITVGTDGVATINATAAPSVPIQRIFGEVATLDTTVAAPRRTFRLGAVPTPGSARVYLNGLRQTVIEDYTITGQAITFVAKYGDLTSTTSRRILVTVDSERLQ